MSKVFSALAVSVDGYITGRNPAPGRGLGDGGMLFDWYFEGDVASQVFEGFRLSEPSARVFDALAGRVGASIAGRNTYDDSDRFGDDSGPHPTAPLFVLSHRPRRRCTGGRHSSPPASRTPSPPRARPPATRTSPSWAVAS
jgi:hypothetical protein